MKKSFSEPFLRLQTCLAEAEQKGLRNHNAAALATVNAEGRPSCRMVLLKQVEETGLVFFTNYESRKSLELENRHAALTCYWDALEQQVRVEGLTEKTSHEESADYFASRPRGSQLSAWASAQSQEIASREVLEQKLKQIEERFAEQTVPLPPFWGGWRVIPLRIEFWTGRTDRLHERILYWRDSVSERKWNTGILSP